MSLIAKYQELVSAAPQKDVNYELEVRLPTMRYDAFKAIYDRVAAVHSPATLSKAVDISYQMGTSRRCITHIEFEGDRKLATNVVEKMELGRFRVEHKYSLVLAKETVLATNPGEVMPVTRVKARMSFKTFQDNSSGWRYDFTMIFPCESPAAAVDVRRNWLNAITAENYLETALECSHTCQFEVEAEAIGPVPPNDVDSVLKLLLFSDRGEETLARARKLLGLVGDTNIKSLAQS
jgi:hypothetical protein